MTEATESLLNSSKRSLIAQVILRRMTGIGWGGYEHAVAVTRCLGSDWGHSRGRAILYHGGRDEGPFTDADPSTPPPAPYGG